MATLDDILSSENMKELFLNYLGAQYPRLESGIWIRLLLLLGGSEGLNLEVGGQRSTFAMKTKPNRAISYPNDASATQLSHAESERQTLKRMSICNEFRYGRVKMPVEVYEQWKLAMNKGQFSNEMLESIDDVMDGLNDSFNSEFFNDGYGQITYVNDTATIAAAATGDLVVDSRQHVRMGFILEPWRSGSLHGGGDILLRCDGVTLDSGAGVCTFKNIGGTSYTAQANDELRIAYSTDRAPTPGLRHACDDSTAYPRAVMQNVALNDPLFKGFRQSLNRALRVEDMALIEQIMYDRQPEVETKKSFKGMDGKDKKVLQAVWVMAMQALNNLHYDVQGAGTTERNRKMINEWPKEYDPGMGWIRMVNGRPVKVSQLCRHSDAFFLTLGNFRARFGKPFFVTEGANGFSHLPKSTDKELIIGQMNAGLCVRRQMQAMFTDVTPWDGNVVWS